MNNPVGIHENPFKNCENVRQLLNQLTGAGSTCWQELPVEVGVGKIVFIDQTERVFDSAQAERFAAYAYAALRNLTARLGGWLPDDPKAVANATLAASHGGCEGKSIIEILQDDLDTAMDSYMDYVEKRDRGEFDISMIGEYGLINSEKCLSHADGIVDGLCKALAKMRSSSADHEWEQAKERFEQRNPVQAWNKVTHEVTKEHIS